MLPLEAAKNIQETRQYYARRASLIEQAVRVVKAKEPWLLREPNIARGWTGHSLITPTNKFCADFMKPDYVPWCAPETAHRIRSEFRRLEAEN